jgi:hypothetical protein
LFFLQVPKSIGFHVITGAPGSFVRHETQTLHKPSLKRTDPVWGHLWVTLEVHRQCTQTGPGFMRAAQKPQKVQSKRTDPVLGHLGNPSAHVNRNTKVNERQLKLKIWRSTRRNGLTLLWGTSETHRRACKKSPTVNQGPLEAQKFQKHQTKRSAPVLGDLGSPSSRM